MPADREALQARLRALFVDELTDNASILNRGLVALEQHDDGLDATSLVNEMFRAAHSLKGGAHSAGVGDLVQLCHHLEDALSRLRDGTLTPTAPVIEPLLAGVDALTAAAQRMRGGGEAGGPDIARAGRRLVALVGTASLVGAAAGPAPARPAPARPSTTVTSATEPAEGPAAPAPEEPARSAPAAPEGNVRVSAHRLETILNEAGELLHACGRVTTLAEALREAAGAAGRRATHAGEPVGGATSAEEERAWRQMGERLDGLARDAVKAGRVVDGLARGVAVGVQHARMVPLTQAFDGLERVVRDLASTVGKEVRLDLRGGHVEVDRPVLEAIADAALHLVRNAVDHGIEAPPVRAAAGKPNVGRVSVDAELVQDGVAVTIADDGRGVDVEALRTAARRRGIAAPEDETMVAEMAFVAGVSTAPLITEVSGRGVGLDAVRARVEAVGGSVVLRSGPGAGCTVTLSLPLALSAVRVLLVEAAGETLALPSLSATRLLSIGPAELRPLGDRHGIVVPNGPVPVLWLSEILGFSDGLGTMTPPFSGILTGTPPNEAVLVVDRFLGEEEVVMKPLGSGPAAVPGVLGATVLPSGRVALVLNPVTCVRAGLVAPAPAPVVSEGTDGPTVRSRVLLAEDTITTRALERSILEAAGYEVLVAVDGLDAWQLLEEHGADIIVSDVDMPRMNGISLCEATRRSSKHREVPFVLVTSLATDADRRRGVEAGANAYIVKGDFDQALLLDTLERLL